MVYDRKLLHLEYLAQSHGLFIPLILLALPYIATAHFCSDNFVTHPPNMLPLTPLNFLAACKKQFIQTHVLQQSLPSLATPCPELSYSPLHPHDILVLTWMACCHVIWPIFIQWLVVSCVLNYHPLSLRENVRTSRSQDIFSSLSKSLCILDIPQSLKKVKGMLNKSRLKQNSQMVKLILWTLTNRLWTSAVTSANECKGGVGKYRLEHLLHAGANTTAGACKLSWECHPKILREETFHFKKNLLVGEGINGDGKRNNMK